MEDKTNKMIELLTKMKELLIKGMPGYYVSNSLVPVEGIDLEFQERMFLVKSIRTDLSQMKLSDEEKTLLYSYTLQYEFISLELEAQRIGREMSDKLKEVLKHFSGKINNEG